MASIAGEVREKKGRGTMVNFILRVAYPQISQLKRHKLSATLGTKYPRKKRFI